MKREPASSTKFQLKILYNSIYTPYLIPAGCFPLVIIISFHLMTEYSSLKSAPRLRSLRSLRLVPHATLIKQPPAPLGFVRQRLAIARSCKLPNTILCQTTKHSLAIARLLTTPRNTCTQFHRDRVSHNNMRPNLYRCYTLSTRMHQQLSNLRHGSRSYRRARLSTYKTRFAKLVATLYQIR